MLAILARIHASSIDSPINSGSRTFSLRFTETSSGPDELYAIAQSKLKRIPNFFGSFDIDKSYVSMMNESLRIFADHIPAAVLNFLSYEVKDLKNYSELMTLYYKQATADLHSTIEFQTSSKLRVLIQHLFSEQIQLIMITAYLGNKNKRFLPLAVYGLSLNEEMTSIYAALHPEKFQMQSFDHWFRQISNTIYELGKPVKNQLNDSFLVSRYLVLITFTKHALLRTIEKERNRSGYDGLLAQLDGRILEFKTLISPWLSLLNFPKVSDDQDSKNVQNLATVWNIYREINQIEVKS
jgi:hypothetical protein